MQSAVHPAITDGNASRAKERRFGIAAKGYGGSRENADIAMQEEDS
jgi:hypothetical protein